MNKEIHLSQGKCTKCGISRYDIVRTYSWGDCFTLSDIDEQTPQTKTEEITEI